MVWWIWFDDRYSPIDVVRLPEIGLCWQTLTRFRSKKLDGETGSAFFQAGRSDPISIFWQSRQLIQLNIRLGHLYNHTSDQISLLVCLVMPQGLKWRPFACCLWMFQMADTSWEITTPETDGFLMQSQYWLLDWLISLFTHVYLQLQAVNRDRNSWWTWSPREAHKESLC